MAIVQTTPPQKDTVETLTNKTLTSPKVNEDVAVSATASELNITDGGSPAEKSLNVQAKAAAYASASQDNLSANSWTKIVLGTEIYDVGSDFASSSFTAPVTGYYLVTGVVTYQNGTPAGRVMGSIYVNGSAVAYQYGIIAGDGYGGCSLSDIAYVTSGQTVELYGLVVGNSTTDVFTGNGNTQISVHLLSI